jgi:acetyl-CoA acetyltransferase
LQAVVSGLGQSEVGRRLFRPAIDLTLDAALAAIEDAGLTPADIDGLSAYPGAGHSRPGFGGPSLVAIHDALRLNLSWYGSGFEVPAQMSAIISAAMAVTTGLARHVLVYRTVTEGSARALAKGNARAEPGQSAAVSAADALDLTGPAQWWRTYGVTGAPQWYAPYLRRYMHDFGLTREQLGQLAVSARIMAARNPKAIYKEPIGLDDYLSARMISDPICLYDCDVHCDGSTAFVVSGADLVSDLPRPGVRIEAVGCGAGPRMYNDQLLDFWFGAPAAKQMWSRTDLRPADVDVAEIYDGFTVITLSWLEALGLCGRGEAGSFIEDGRSIALDGPLPLNTNGGQLAGGRLHGLGLFHEACVQLRGDGGERQVADAEVAVVANGGLPNMSCALLTRSK